MFACEITRPVASSTASSTRIFVSIHVNWIENRSARGVETYYLGATNDPFLNKLAAAENFFGECGAIDGEGERAPHAPEALDLNRGETRPLRR